MAISSDELRQCKKLDDVRVLLGREFKAGNYEDVYDAIQLYYTIADVNKSFARKRLFDTLVPFTSNYIVAPKLGHRDMMDWEAQFPELLQDLGEAREESWSVFLLDRATWRREGLRNAIGVIIRTVDQFNAS